MRIMLSVLIVVLFASIPCLALQPVQTEEASMADITTNISDIEKKMNEENAATAQRLNALEKKTGELSNKLGSAFSSTSIEQRLKDLDRRLARIERDLDQLKSRVSKVESKK